MRRRVRSSHTGSLRTTGSSIKANNRWCGLGTCLPARQPNERKITAIPSNCGHWHQLGSPSQLMLTPTGEKQNLTLGRQRDHSLSPSKAEEKQWSPTLVNSWSLGLKKPIRVICRGKRQQICRFRKTCWKNISCVNRQDTSWTVTFHCFPCTGRLFAQSLPLLLSGPLRTRWAMTRAMCAGLLLIRWVELLYSTDSCCRAAIVAIWLARRYIEVSSFY